MLPIAILAGGFGTRLGKLSLDIPKCLIPINKRPFVDWQLDLLQEAGYKKVVFCLSHKSEQVQEHLGDGSKYGLNIEYSLDGEKQLGTGGAVKRAIPQLGEHFAVTYGDSFLPIIFQGVEERVLRNNPVALMTVYENKNQLDKSNVEFKNGKIIEYKKNSDNPSMHHIDYGLMYFHASVFEAFSPNEAFDLGEVCSALSKSGNMAAFEVKDRFYEIGSPRGIEELSNFLRKEKP